MLQFPCPKLTDCEQAAANRGKRTKNGDTVIHVCFWLLFIVAQFSKFPSRCTVLATFWKQIEGIDSFWCPFRVSIEIRIFVLHPSPAYQGLSWMSWRFCSRFSSYVFKRCHIHKIPLAPPIMIHTSWSQVDFSMRRSFHRAFRCERKRPSKCGEDRCIKHWRPSARLRMAGNFRGSTGYLSKSSQPQQPNPATRGITCTSKPTQPSNPRYKMHQ
jgi:hypothetical protein